MELVSGRSSGESGLKGSNKTVKEQLSADLQNYVNQYKDPSKALRIISEKIGIHKKTLHRILNQKNKASYLTIYKIYRFLFNTNNDSDLLKLVPKVIKVELEKEGLRSDSETYNFISDLDIQFKTDSIFREIFLLVDAGSLSLEFVQLQYGQKGLQVLNKMIHEKVLKLSNSGSIELAENRPSLSTESLKLASQQLIENYSKPQNCDQLGENFLAFYVESLSKEGFNEWLKVDKQAFLQKVEIAKKYKDPVAGEKVFSVQVTDTMKTKGWFDEEDID